MSRDTEGNGFQRTFFMSGANPYTVRALLNNPNVRINAKNKDNRTLLHLAAKNGHTETVEVLIEKGADLDIKDNEGKTPLHLAAENGHTAIVESLIKAGADVNALDKYVQTPLDRANEKEHIETAALLKKAATILSFAGEPDRYLDKALVEEVRNGHFTIVKTLIIAGADVNVTDCSRNTLLHCLALLPSDMDARNRTISVLIAAKADPNARDHRGKTPLHNAVIAGFISAIQKLKKAGADINVQDNDGKTPLHYAAIKGHTETINLLKKEVADINVQDNEGKTPLHYAAIKGHADVINLLKEAGADVNVQDNDGQTPLHYAAAYGQTKTAEALIEAKADINAQDKNDKDESNNTPLHLAAEYDKIETVNLLIAKGANLRVENAKKLNPQGSAYECGKHHIASLLSEAKSNELSKGDATTAEALQSKANKRKGFAAEGSPGVAKRLKESETAAGGRGR